MKIIKEYKFLPKNEIERRAENILIRVQANRKRPVKFPLDAGHLAESLGLDMDCDNIPPDEDGIIAAMILPSERKIIINETSLDLPRGFEESSIAHEIGHWELHIDQKAVVQIEENRQEGKEVIIEPFLCRNVNASKGIEWQAQYFAACLLMPRFKLEEVQRGRNLTNWKHLYAIANELGVTISHLKYRLQDLELIYVDKNSKQIYPGKALLAQ